MAAEPHKWLNKYVNANRRSHIFALAVFCVLVAVFTWPLLPNINTHYPSLPSIGGSNDPSFFVGYLDVVAKGIVGQNPVPTESMIYYPRGVDMLGAYDGPLMFLVALPARLISGNPVFAYNLTLLAGFLFTAMATYFLLRQLVGNWGMSVFGGALYGFSSYMQIRGLAHLNLMMLGVVPLLVLAALKFCKKPSPKGALWLFIVTLLAALSSWYYALSGLLFVFLVFLFYWRNLWEEKAVALVAGLAIGGALLLVAAPLLTAETKGSSPASDEFAFNASTQPENLFLPLPTHPWLGKFTNGVYEKFPTVIVPRAPNYYEMTSYLGLTGLFALGAVLLRKRLSRPDLWFWAVSGLTFLILSLGPYVYLFHHRILLPFYFLRRIYPFGLFRVPNRFFVVTLLCAVVLAIYLLDHLRQKVGSRRMGYLGMTAIGGLMFFENSMLPYPVMNFPVPEFYRQIALDRRTYAIADLPIHQFAIYNYYQSVHGKPIVEGHFFYPGMVPMTYLFINLNPLLYNSMCQDLPEAPLPQPDAALKQLADADVRYVVVHNLLIHSQPTCDKAGIYIRKFFADRQPVYSDGEITVYSTSD